MKKLLAYMLVAVMLLSYIPVVSFAADSNIASKLLAEYNFDDQTTNNSAGSKHAVIGTSVSDGKADYEDGVSGKALKLTEAGSSEKYWLNIPYSVFENNTDSFTISVWYKATGYNTSGQDSELFSLYNSSAEKFLFYSPTMISNNNLGYTMKWAGSGTYGYANTSSLSYINQWTHLVYTVEAVANRSVVKMYVNGEQITATQNGHWDDSLMSLLGVDTFTIGGYNKWKGGSACSMYGSVDEIRLYAGALTKEEAKQLYDENASGGNMPEVDESEQLKILAIGNSFSIDATTYLWDVMKDGGYSNHTVAVAYIGGSALDDHWGNIQNDKPAYEYWKNTNGVWTTSPGCTLLEILTAEQWDIITLQQQSLKAGQPSTYSNLEDILDFVYTNKTNKDAKVYWHMTWGYPSANPDSEYKTLYNNDQMAMYNAIVSTVQSNIVGNSRFAGIIPSGTAIQNLRSSYLGDIMCRDTVHLSEDQGRYTAAMMWYAYLLNGDISKIDWVPSNYGYVANDLPAIREAILDALATPFAVSQCTSARVGESVQDGDLIGQWNFDNSNTKDSVGNYHGTLWNNSSVATGTYVDGVSGKALKLSTQGTDEKYWLDIPYSVFGGNQNSFTISLWYNSAGHNTSGENSELFSLYNKAGERFLFYGAQMDGNKNAFTMKWDGTYGYANVIGGYKENEWVHLVYVVDVVDGQSKITAYINGKAVEVDQGGEWANSLMSQLGIDTFTIGGKNPYKGGNTPNCLFYGAVDEIRLYAGALTEEQAAEIYYDVVAPVYDRGTIIAEYNFDNMTTRDATGKHHAVFYDHILQAQPKFAEGIVGKALRLSTYHTVEKYWLDIPYRAFGGHKDSFTLSMWYYADGRNTAGENSQLFSLYNSSSERYMFYGIPTDDSENAFITKQDNTYGYANVIGGYGQKQWIHLVLTVDGSSGESKITAYINGKAVEVDQGGEWANSLMSQLGMDTFTIGGKNPYKGGFVPQCLFYGMVDEIKLYAGVLTAYEAAEIYKEHRMPEQRGTLLAEYHFNDENTCDSVLDRDAVFYENENMCDAVFAEGINGKGLRLSEQGSSEQYWLDIPYAVFGGNNADTFTVSIWYRCDGCNTEGVSTELFTLYNSEKEKYLYYTPSAVDLPEEGLVDHLSDVNGYANINHTYQAGEWTHLVFTVGTKGTQSRINAYINGKSLTVNTGGDWTNTLMSLMGMDRFTIGGRNPYRMDTDDSSGTTFYGCVDEIQIYAGELTQQEARNLYEQQVTLWIDAEPITDYAYAFAAIPETKTVNFHDPENLHKVYDWVMEQAQDIQFVFELGDITDQNTDEEWALAQEQSHRLDGVIPHCVARGECDAESRFDESFPYRHDGSGLSGSYDQTMRNTYQKLTVGEISYLMVNLDVGASDDVLQWANQIVSAHSDCRVIVTTHAYLDASGNPLAATSKYAPTVWGFANDGQDIWEKFISRHINIDLVLCSHSQCDDIVVSTAEGVYGNTVTQMLINPESLDSGYGSCGMVAMLYFSEDGRKIDVRYYSTLREKYFKAKNQFTLELPAVMQAPMGEVAQLQIALQDDISMNLYTVLTDAYLQDTGNYAQITVGEECVTVPVSNAEVKTVDGVTYHIFTAKVAAAQMTEKITLQLFRSSGESSEAYSCTVRDYARKLLSSEENSACHSLVKQLLNYGAKAQLYFGVHIDDLANQGYEMDNPEIIPAEEKPVQVTGSISGLDFYGASLLFRNQVAVRYYFTGNAENVSFLVNGEKWDVKQKDGMYYVEVSGICPQQYGQMVTVMVTDGNETMNVSYSPLQYIVRMYNGSASQNLKMLVNALYAYHLEALAYTEE